MFERGTYSHMLLSTSKYRSKYEVIELLFKTAGEAWNDFALIVFYNNLV